MKKKKEALLDINIIIDNLSSQASRVFPGISVQKSVDSTNHIIKEFQPPHILLAEEQTQGKGRYGRTWQSPFAKGIYMSILLGADKFSCGTSGLSLAIGVMIGRFLADIGIDIRLKWPNDLHIVSIRKEDLGAKLGGVLVELDEDFVIIGTGINYHHQSFDLTNKRTVAIDNLVDVEETGRSIAVAGLINRIESGLGIFFARGFAPFKEEWNNKNLLSDMEVAIDGSNHRGICLGVDKEGSLLLKDKSGEISKNSSGSIVVVSYH